MNTYLVLKLKIPIIRRFKVNRLSKFQKNYLSKNYAYL